MVGWEQRRLATLQLLQAGIDAVKRVPVGKSLVVVHAPQLVAELSKFWVRQLVVHRIRRFRGSLVVGHAHLLLIPPVSPRENCCWSTSSVSGAGCAAVGLVPSTASCLEPRRSGDSA